MRNTRPLHPHLLRFLRAAGALFAALGFLVIFVTVTPVDVWWASALAGSYQEKPGQVLIVLGGSINDNGSIGGSSYWRCLYASELWNRGGFKQVVTSGGASQGPSVAQSMADFLVCQGVPRTAIRLETRSETTRENALYSAELLKSTPGPLVLITSDYHMFRAYRCFRKVGLEVLPNPSPDVLKRATSWRGRWPAFLDLVEESCKIIYYYARGWI